MVTSRRCAADAPALRSSVEKTTTPCLSKRLGQLCITAETAATIYDAAFDF